MRKLKLNFGILAFIAGLTMAITGTAFKSSSFNGVYGKVNGTGPWVDVNSSPGPNQEYYCDLLGDLCHAEFTGNPQTDPNAEMGQIRKKAAL